MKRVFLLLSNLLACIFLFGQAPKLANTLLWRISGNGLSTPSYLYGTMHLTDKKVFQLGDSLYRSIEQAEGFAGELDMNKLGVQLLNYIIAEKEAKAATEALKVKDAVPPEVWDRYKERLQAKFYKSADKITVDDLEELESSLENDLYKKGDMPTFLDAYLFGIARKQGKWVGGLEDLQDQLEHINTEDIESKIQVALFDDKYYRSGIESMIKYYTAQKLDSIDAMMYREENGRKDYIMIKRNLKMARMMDSLSAVRSTFFAVGAAHLPGDSGVISLLQKRGFTVTPVISSKKISPEKYVTKTKDIPWMPVAIKDSVYKLEMPGIAENIEMLESMGISMKMFFDISMMKIYMTFGTEMSGDRKKLGADSIYSAMRARLFAKAEVTREKAVTVNGIDGREYTGSTDDGEIKIQIFLPAMEEIVLNMVFSMGKKSLNDEESEKFFGSFVYNGLDKTHVEPEKTWSVVTNPNLLFSVELPAKPREAKDVNSQEGSILHTYQTVDVKNQVFYGMNITSMKEGMYQGRFDSSYFIRIKDVIKAGIGDSKVLDSSFINFNNYTGYKFALAGTAQGQNIETKVMSIERGNRNYYIYAVYAPSEVNRAAAERFLGSFKILPVTVSGWKTITSPDTSFSVVTPVPLKKVSVDADDYHLISDRYVLYDSIISSSIYIDKVTIPDWYWFASDTAFLRQRSLQSREYYDSIAGYTVTTQGKTSIADYTVFSNSSNNNIIKKVKLVLNGNELFEMVGHFDPRDLKDHYSRVFDEFRAMKDPPLINRAQPKVNELAQILRDADAEETKNIGKWWNGLEFAANDLPALQKMSLQLYPDFDSSGATGINRKIFDKINELDSLHSTVEYLKKNYRAIAGKDEYLKPYVIGHLAGIRTFESYSLLKDILINYPFNSSVHIFGSYKLYDSLKLTASLFPEILKYADTPAFSWQIQSLTLRLLDSGLINKKMIVDHGKGFVSYAKRKLDKEKESVEESGYDSYNCIKILGIINSPQANALLARFAKFNNRGIRYTTMIAQLTNNQVVDSRTIYTMATTDEYRHDLYDNLKKIGKLKLFPVSFLSQKELGKSKVYEHASDDETSPPLITHAGEKIIEYKGQQKKFYLYKVETDVLDAGNYLGIAGPYSLDYKDYGSSHEATGIYFEKNYDAKKLDVYLKEYLLWLEEKKTMEDELKPPPALPPHIK